MGLLGREVTELEQARQLMYNRLWMDMSVDDARVVDLPLPRLNFQDEDDKPTYFQLSRTVFCDLSFEPKSSAYDPDVATEKRQLAGGRTNALIQSPSGLVRVILQTSRFGNNNTTRRVVTLEGEPSLEDSHDRKLAAIAGCTAYLFEGAGVWQQITQGRRRRLTPDNLVHLSDTKSRQAAS